MKKSLLHGSPPSETIVRRRITRCGWPEAEARALPVGAKRDAPTAHYRAPETEITQERCVALFKYDPETGVLTRKAKSAPHTNIGERVGSLNSAGYLNTMVDGKLLAVHRVIWLMLHGLIPEQIDHINGVRTDNRLANLRAASGTLNSQNRRRANSNNSVGLLGVSRDGKKFRASIAANGEQHSLGNFDSAEEAHEAYLIAKRKLHEGCTL